MMTNNVQPSIDDQPAPQSPYARKRQNENYNKPPYCIYFFQVKEETTGDGKKVLRMKHYYLSDNGPIRRDRLTQIARQLGINARLDHGAPPEYGYDFDKVWFTRKSYVMFLLDEEQITFAEGKALKIAREGTESENYTFFDGEDFTVDLSPRGDGSQPRSGVYCINHMKGSDQGEDLGQTTQKFFFTLTDTDTATGLVRESRLPDSGGTNGGPPVPPPE